MTFLCVWSRMFLHHGGNAYFIGTFFSFFSHFNSFLSFFFLECDWYSYGRVLGRVIQLPASGPWCLPFPLLHSGQVHRGPCTICAACTVGAEEKSHVPLLQGRRAHAGSGHMQLAQAMGRRGHNAGAAAWSMGEGGVL